MRTRLHLGAVWFAALAACTSKRTELVVLVDSDYAVPAELAKIEAIVKPTEGGEQMAHEFVLGALPLSFGVVPPGGDANRKLDVLVEGVDPGGRALVTRHAISGFIEGKTLLLDMFLAKSCAGGGGCAAADTCTEHGCAPATIDPGTLPEVSPGAELKIDAGVPALDGGRGDGGAPSDDAAVTEDATSGDAPSDGGQGAADGQPDAFTGDGPAPDARFEDASADAGPPADAGPDASLPDAEPSDGGPVAAMLTFGSSSQTIGAGACSQAVIIERRDAMNLLVSRGTTNLGFGAAPMGLAFFSDARCTVVLQSLTIADGESSASFYFSSSVPQAYTLSLSAPPLTGATQMEVITGGAPAALVITTPPRMIAAGGCSLAVTIGRQDAFQNPTDQGTTTVSLGAIPSTSTSFYGNGLCSSPALTSVAIGPGQTSADVFFSGTIAGTDIVSASSPTLITATQSETIAPASPRSLVITSAPKDQYQAECSISPATVEVEDAYGNPSPVSGMMTVDLSADINDLHFFQGPACAASVRQISIASGASSGTFHFAAASPGTPTITAQAQSLNSASQREAIHHAVCSSGAWCWQSPMIQGDSLHGVWAASLSQFWAVGDGGQVLFFDGASWSREESGVADDLLGVWGASISSVYAVGRGGRILRRTGAGWGIENSTSVEDLFAVWGTSDSDVWAVGANGTFLHRTAAGWTGVTPNPGTSENIRAIFGFSPASAFAVGDNGTIVTLDAGGWGAQTVGQVSYSGVWGTSSTDVWAGGDNGTAIHFNGMGWSSAFSTGLSTTRGFWGTSSTDVWAIGGGGASAAPNGRMAHWNGMSWTSNDPAGGGTADAVLQGVTGAVSGGVGRGWAVGDRNELVSFDPSTDLWSNQYTTVLPNTLNGVFGASASDLWAFGANAEIAHYNGTNWSRAPLLVPAGTQLNAGWGSSTSDVYFVGQGAVAYHYDGANFVSVSTGFGGNYTGVWGTASNNVYIITTGGVVIHYDGSMWSGTTLTGTPRLRAIHGTGPGDIWAVGDNGTTRHFNGTSWSAILTPLNTPALRGVHASATDDVWAVGDAGTVLHYNGSLWTRASSIPLADYRGIAGVGSALVTVGGGGTILQLTSGIWSAAESGTVYGLNGVYSLSGAGTWVVGANASILRR
jgi:hypothetical protein